MTWLKPFLAFFFKPVLRSGVHPCGKSALPLLGHSLFDMILVNLNLCDL